MSGCRRPCRRGDGANGSSWEQLAARARTQAGFSLTESLAAILLVTLVIMGIAAGILTTVRATRTVAQTQKSEAALSDATEVLKARPYQRCADLSTYGTIPDVTVTTVEYLQAGAAGEQFAPTCDPATDTAQRITIVVGGRSADVVKRDPTAVTP
ncbi:MAG: hypothetical protein R2696_16840 [Microthrixaceae bacterium]